MFIGGLVCRTELFEGTVITELGSLIALRMTVLQNNGSQLAMYSVVRQVDMNIVISTKVRVVTKKAWPAEHYLDNLKNAASLEKIVRQ